MNNKHSEDLEEKIRKFNEKKREREELKMRGNGKFQNKEPEKKIKNTGYVSDWQVY